MKKEGQGREKRRTSRPNSKKMVDEFAKKHNLTRGTSAEMRDRYSLLADPGLKELKDRYYKDNAKRHGQDGRGGRASAIFRKAA